MNVPPRYLVGCALLFWGWASLMPVFGAVLAILYELGRDGGRRIDFQEKDLRRVFDLCTLFFVGAFLYRFMTRNSGGDLLSFLLSVNFTNRDAAMNRLMGSAYIFGQWWPILLSPIVLAQIYSGTARVPYSVLSVFLRKKVDRDPRAREIWQGRGMHLGWPFFLVVLLSAAMTNPQGPWFLGGFSLLTAWALYSLRRPRFRLITWLLVVALSAKLAYFGAEQYQRIQSLLEQSFSEWFNGMMRQAGDGTKSRTAIGKIGKAKLSGKIRHRVEGMNAPLPDLIREASYTYFDSGVWYTTPRGFGDIITEDDTATRWRLRSSDGQPFRMKVSAYLGRGQGLLPIPHGASRLTHLPVGEVKTNSFGTVHAMAGPGMVEYRVEYDGSGTIDVDPGSYEPEDADFSAPEIEFEALDQIASELNLRDLEPRDMSDAIARFFERDFTYSSWLTIGDPDYEGLDDDGYGETPLSNFLLITRTGHCEYFATAATLLMRRAGVPARYTTGFAVIERKTDNTALLRDRHAHAWVIYFDSGTGLWHEFDPTPGSWVAGEEEHKGGWHEPFTDLFSHFWYAFSKWRWLGERGPLQQFLGWGLTLLLLAFMVRVLRQARRARRQQSAEFQSFVLDRPGLDSEFYLIEKWFRKRGMGRFSDEPIRLWWERIRSTSGVVDKDQTLEHLMNLHHRLRFSPAGLPESEREELRHKVRWWLKQRH